MPAESPTIRIVLAVDESSILSDSANEIPGSERIQVVGVAHNEEEVEVQIQQWSPDIVLLDADDPDYNALDLTQRLAFQYADVSVILMSSDQSPTQLRRAMLAGAGDYLIKPVDAETVINTILNIAEVQEQKRLHRAGDRIVPRHTGQLIAFIAGKGGIGRTTLATNLAVAAAQELGKKVALVGLENGDAAVLLNVTPQVGLSDLVEAAPELDAHTLVPYLATHKSGVALLISLGIADYYQAQPLQNPHMQTVLSILKTVYDYVFIDFPPLLNPEDAQILSAMDQICLVTSSWDLLVLRNSKALLDMLPPHLTDRVKIIVNRSDRTDMIQESHVTKSLDRPVLCTIQNDSRIAPAAINVGDPFVLSHPQSPIAKDILNLARILLGVQEANGKVEKKKKFLFFGA